MTSTMAARLRHVHDYIGNHKVFDHGVMHEAADYIERLEEQLEGARDYIKEIEAAAVEHSRTTVQPVRPRGSVDIVHLLADGTRVFTLAEAEALTGVKAATIRRRLNRAKVVPAGQINPREPVYTAQQAGIYEPGLPKMITADVRVLYAELAEDNTHTPHGDLMQTVDDWLVRIGLPSVLYR